MSVTNDRRIRQRNDITNSLTRALTLTADICSSTYIMATKRKTPATLTETLRQAIADSGLPFLELERQTGVIRQSLMKFARSEQTLMLDAADKLAEFFDLELVERKGK